MIKVYGIKNCDSVKKALKFFKAHNLECELQDFKSQSVSCDKIAFWLESVELKTIFNAKSATYRNLKLKEKKLTPNEQADFLCKENLLIKRPVVEFGDKIVVGYDEDNYKGVFL